ncbi:MAG: cache domain-containing protein, partial [Treponema sp.]|nr:cache domain-containing protein [Treponema sp.]
MSIRTKAVFWLISITIVISAANFGSGFLFTRAKLLETMENELVLARDIADDLISTRVNLLKSDARTVAERLKAAAPDALETAMGGELEGYPDFLALTIFDRRGITAAWGGPVTAESRFGDTKYLRNALEGESLISTTVVDEDSGELVMYVCVPMNDRVLCVTIPGMLFARLLGNYRLWDTGNIFMIDEEGTMIASYLSPLV